MANLILLVSLICLISAANCKPLEENLTAPRLWKRFINPAMTMGEFVDNALPKMRTKRSTEEDCEKLQLCKLHARSGSNFVAAFELYFVNKENARLWDHQSRTMADCESRFSCNGEGGPAPAPAAKQQDFVDDDYYEQ